MTFKSVLKKSAGIGVTLVAVYCLIGYMYLYAQANAIGAVVNLKFWDDYYVLLEGWKVTVELFSKVSAFLPDFFILLKTYQVNSSSLFPDLNSPESKLIITSFLFAVFFLGLFCHKRRVNKSKKLASIIAKKETNQEKKTFTKNALWQFIENYFIFSCLALLIISWFFEDIIFLIAVLSTFVFSVLIGIVSLVLASIPAFFLIIAGVIADDNLSEKIADLQLCQQNLLRIETCHIIKYPEQRLLFRDADAYFYLDSVGLSVHKVPLNKSVKTEDDLAKNSIEVYHTFSGAVVGKVAAKLASRSSDACMSYLNQTNIILKSDRAKLCET